MTDLEIKYFLGVVDNDCSFTKASQALYISQPSLSYHVIALGKALGIKLFDTSNKSHTKLTPGGKLVYQYFSKCSDTLRKIIIKAKKLNAISAEELKIACSIDSDASDISDSIVDFRSRHKNIDVQFDSAGFKQMETNLKNNYYDIIITTLLDFNKTDRYVSSVFFEVPIILLFSKKHKLAKKRKPCIIDFKNEIFYVLSKNEKPTAKPVHENYCKSKGFIPQFRECPNLDSIFRELNTGAGCAILDCTLKICSNTAYKWIELDYMIEIGFVWKKENTNPALKLFLDDVVLTPRFLL